MIIYGKWVSNYNHLDPVVFLKNDYKIYEGLIYLDKGYYSEDFYIISNNLKIQRAEILVLSNTSNNLFYKENSHLLYQVLIEQKDKIIKQLSCNHKWNGKSENQYCKLCGSF